MLTTKRYEYMPFDSIEIHPLISNHRPLKPGKVSHLERDILKNGLLEPLIVWERTNGQYYMVGGFHRLAAIKAIREKHAGYFDRMDVRLVSGELDEMRALKSQAECRPLRRQDNRLFRAGYLSKQCQLEQGTDCEFFGQECNMDRGDYTLCPRYGFRA